MLKNLDFISERDLTEWVEQHLYSEKYALSSGYQGKTLLFDEHQHKLVIKVPLGNMLTRPINLALLRHEYKVYQKLEGLRVIPVCYGMASNKYLVIEFIDGQTIRHQRPATDSVFFIKLLSAITEMHQRGVAHFDLKRPENLLVTKNEEPIIIDFGVSIIKKSGLNGLNLHWLNRFLYKLALQFDYNAWAKHKYNKQMHLINDEDKIFYRKTVVEIVSKKIKFFYRERFLKLFKQ